ncbi:hypothetical protein ACKWTF_003491 [Chironomus riparius]
MNIIGFKFLLLVLVTICYNLDKICAQNATKMLTPIIATNVLGPKQFERIVVPYYPPIIRKEIPVTEKVVDIENTTQEVKTNSIKAPNYNGGKKSDTKSYSYVTRSDGFSKKPPPKKYSPVSQPKQPPKVIEPKSKDSKPNPKDLPAEHRTLPEPNEIQPLHINTRGFKKSQPDHKNQAPEEKKKKFQEQEQNLKIENLPGNPEEVPKTDWFDNHGKYNYGIVHDSPLVEEKTSVEDTTENESKEVPKGVAPNPQKIQHPQPFQPPITVQHPQPVATIYHPPATPTPTNNNHHPLTFKSNSNVPSSHSKVHQQNGNNGNFLYKSEVYYPNYRDHIYLPFTTYYGDANIFPKHLPVFNSHTVYHTPQAVPQHNTINQNSNKAHDLPIKVSLPIPKAPTSSSTPKTVYPVVHKTEPPAHKHPASPKKAVEEKKTAPTAPKNNQDEEEEYDESEEIEDDGGKAEYYDYEEGDSVEDDERSNDKIQGESSEDYEEENDDEEEEKPTYRYTSYNNARDDEKSSEDEFDRAWEKYGYSPKETSEENESSESRLVPQEIEPGRKKIVHMKMEYHTVPHDGNHVYDIEPKIRRSIDVSNKSSREMNSKMSGTINNSEMNKDKKRKRKNKKSSAKSQQQHPNAGPDDLKFFQYLNYLGNGEHRAGGRVGNDKHYIEQHERGSKVTGTFQKKVKWADKDGKLE